MLTCNIYTEMIHTMEHTENFYFLSLDLGKIQIAAKTLLVLVSCIMVPRCSCWSQICPSISFLYHRLLWSLCNRLQSGPWPISTPGIWTSHPTQKLTQLMLQSAHTSEWTMIWSSALNDCDTEMFCRSDQAVTCCTEQWRYLVSLKSSTQQFLSVWLRINT